MTYVRNDEPFELTEKNAFALYEDGMEYLSEVLGEYTDTIMEDPLTGLNLAITDWMDNESPIERIYDEDEIPDENKPEGTLTWEDAMKLCGEIFKVDTLKGERAIWPFPDGNLAPINSIRNHKAI